MQTMQCSSVRKTIQRMYVANVRVFDLDYVSSEARQDETYIVVRMQNFYFSPFAQMMCLVMLFCSYPAYATMRRKLVSWKSPMLDTSARVHYINHT